MAKKKGSGDSDDVKANPLAWMMTFSDVLNLLLTFFVLIYSMSSMDTALFRQSFGSIAAIPGAIEGGGTGIMDSIKIIPLTEKQKTEGGLSEKNITTQEEAYKELLKVLQVIKNYNNVKIRNTDNGIILEFEGDINFENGSEVLTDKAQKMLTQIGGILKQIKFPFKIIGYTSARPQDVSRYSSNVELSALRAKNVMLYFVGDCGLNERSLTVIGKGDSQPKNAVKPFSDENNRVEIIVDTSLKINIKNLNTIKEKL